MDHGIHAPHRKANFFDVAAVTFHGSMAEKFCISSSPFVTVKKVINNPDVVPTGIPTNIEPIKPTPELPTLS